MELDDLHVWAYLFLLGVYGDEGSSGVISSFALVCPAIAIASASCSCAC